MERLVRLFSDQGELILDPFTGSGSTGVAALRLGRRFAGWEMNPEYAEMARRRLAAAREQLEIGF
jgi:site-specific DNA-methyltransferase (adenine-specific)